MQTCTVRTSIGSSMTTPQSLREIVDIAMPTDVKAVLGDCFHGSPFPDPDLGSCCVCWAHVRLTMRRRPGKHMHDGQRCPGEKLQALECGDYDAIELACSLPQGPALRRLLDTIVQSRTLLRPAAEERNDGDHWEDMAGAEHRRIMASSLRHARRAYKELRSYIDNYGPVVAKMT